MTKKAAEGKFEGNTFFWYFRHVTVVVKGTPVVFSLL